MHNRDEAVIWKEIKILSSIADENIVKFIGWTLLNNKKGIVMECMHTSLQAGKIIFQFLRKIFY